MSAARVWLIVIGAALLLPVACNVVVGLAKHRAAVAEAAREVLP